MTLGQRLKILRINKVPKVTQENVAKRIGTTRATYSNWEIDRALPDLDSIALLADYYHVSVDYLLGRNPPEKEQDNFFDDFYSLPKEQQKMIKTMARVMKEEQESDDDGSTTNKVSFLDKG